MSERQYANSSTTDAAIYGQLAGAGSGSTATQTPLTTRYGIDMMPSSQTRSSERCRKAFQEA